MLNSSDEEVILHFGHDLAMYCYEHDLNDEHYVKKYCYVVLCGGLGNQLFQIAAAEEYCQRTKRRLKLVPSDERRGYHWDTALYGYKELVSNKVPEDIVQYKESCFNFREIPDAEGDVLIEGYFQSSKYFPNINLNINIKIKERLPSNVITVHARRGDYCYPDNELIHNPQPDEYYTQAKEVVTTRIKDPTYILLSDDDHYWENSPVFKNEKHTILKEDMYDTLSTLISAENFIMSNSTFAWWGVRLSPKKSLVIAPSKWFGPVFYDKWDDIYEDNWIII